jgi:hypothetical protein
MCPKDIRVVKLLAGNNIPFVLHYITLHYNQTNEEEETYIFGNKKMKENVIIPIMKKYADHFAEMSCSQDWVSYINCNKTF